MSGILGIVRVNGSTVNSADLSSMMHEMARYGPDGATTWSEHNVGFGHLMLHVTPQSLHERLPAGPADYVALNGRSLQITSDCRLDNREALCRALSIPAAEWESIPDSQLLLAAYGCWGETCPEHLLGDFAFAIWDADKQILFCARDIMGVRAFYYAQTSSGLYFASDLEALLCAPGIEPVPNEFLLKTILINSDSGHPTHTLFAGVNKLPPAHCLTLDANGLRLREYWRMGRTDEIQLATDRDYADQAVELMQQAIDCRLRSAYPLGSHLSGGMDSSAITVLAARRLRQSGQSLTAFSWSPEADEEGYMPEDERPAIETVCAQEGLTRHYAQASVQERLRVYKQGVNLFGRFPIAPTLENAKIAQSENIRVMLSGWGGDETISFGSKGYLLELLHNGQWRTLAQELPLWAQRKQQHPARIGIGLLRAWLTPRTLKNHRPHPRTRPTLSAEFFESEFVARMAGVKVSARAMPPDWGQDRFQTFVLMGGHHTARMVAWNALTAEYNLEWRHPLLDRRLIEFALNLPPRLYLSNGHPRYLFNLTMEGILPDDMLWRNNKPEPARAAYTKDTGRQAQALYLEWYKETRGPRAYPILSDQGLQHMQEQVQAKVADDLNKDNRPQQAQLFDALQAEYLIEKAQTRI